ncbi:MAG TPA: OmpA family protein [Thermoanaerobaculia bacterium]|nr:OmpA family protein [Thermoanaerobaculia bacterium]
MKKISKATLASIALLALLVSPACKTNRKKVDPVPQPPVQETRAPEVEAPPTRTDTPVEPARDFVVEDQTPTEVMPSDIDALNRWAHEKGYIRDAFFNLAEAQLDEAAQSALQASATWLRGEGAAYNVLIEGHCDERGTEQYNLALGDRRAYAAKEYLTTLGINAGRIRTVSYGEERPFEEGHDESSWAANRRAHIVLVQAR